MRDLPQRLRDRVRGAEEECRTDDADLMLEAARFISDAQDAAAQMRGWIEHWKADVAAGLKPTESSLNAALELLDKMEA